MHFMIPTESVMEYVNDSMGDETTSIGVTVTAMI